MKVEFETVRWNTIQYDQIVSLRTFTDNEIHLFEISFSPLVTC